MPKLLLKFETSIIKEINLDKPSFTVGRKADNDIVLDHTTVSGHHCKVYDAGGTFFVEDLGSTNGTTLNGDDVETPTIIINNDEIHCGKVPIKVYLAMADLSPTTQKV